MWVLVSGRAHGRDTPNDASPGIGTAGQGRRIQSKTGSKVVKFTHTAKQVNKAFSGRKGIRAEIHTTVDVCNEIRLMFDDGDELLVSAWPGIELNRQPGKNPSADQFEGRTFISVHPRRLDIVMSSAEHDYDDIQLYIPSVWSVWGDDEGAAPEDSALTLRMK